MLSSVSHDTASSTTSMPPSTELTTEDTTSSSSSSRKRKAVPANDPLQPHRLYSIYKQGKTIGSGAFGIVNQARRMDGSAKSETLAWKQMTVDIRTNEIRRSYRELAILKRMNHPNILQLKDYSVTRSDVELRIDLITDLMETDMQKIINSRQPLSIEHVSYFMYQLIAGLHYMHSAGLIHRDLKPANMFINADCHLTIGDLGLSRKCSVPSYSKSQPTTPSKPPPTSESENIHTVPMQGFMTEHVTTRWYRSPEVCLMVNTYDRSTDLWSAGCIMADLAGLVVGNPPGPIFPGGSSFPMSPLQARSWGESTPMIEARDQINVIFDRLGDPSPIALLNMNSPRINEHTSTLRNRIQKSNPHPTFKTTRLAAMYPSATEPMIDLMSRMLCYDPKQRITAAEALRHPFLRDLHNPTAEQPYVGQPFDFTDIESDHTSREYKLQLLLALNQ